MNVKLVRPTLEMEQFYHDYIDEWKKDGKSIVPQSANPMDKDYKTWLEEIYKAEKQETCPSNLVPANTYFLMDEYPRILGAINIRHILNDYLFSYGGHIGYGVRPSERMKGYATIMLRMALEKCREMNIMKVLVTCDKDNIASVKTIVANGGILENELPEGGNIKQRYWITLQYS